MSWTYTGNDKLARAATRLYELRAHSCRISPLVFMSDPERTPDIDLLAYKMREGSTLIYRHFGAQGRLKIAKKLRQVTKSRNIQFLIGKDVKLANKVGADGVHLPERDLEVVAKLRKKHPNWLVTGAAHSKNAIELCTKMKLDAAIVSPVFASGSSSVGTLLGIRKFSEMVELAKIPVLALGGIKPDNVHELLRTGAAGIAGVSAFAPQFIALSFEPLLPAHVEEMAILHKQAFDHPWPAEDFLGHIENDNDNVLGIFDQGELLAFIIQRTIDDQAEILTIAVKSSKQKNGLASVLLSLGEHKILDRGVDIIFLEVAADNSAAIRLYEKNGYHQYGTRRGYYRRVVNGRMGRVDAMLFKKHLA